MGKITFGGTVNAILFTYPDQVHSNNDLYVKGPFAKDNPWATIVYEGPIVDIPEGLPSPGNLAPHDHYVVIYQHNCKP